MLNREVASKTSQMKSLRKRLTRWRTEHGGVGRRIPEKLWAEAVEIAAIEGVETTARLLHLDAVRLGDRVAASKSCNAEYYDRKSEFESEFEFVEVELPKEPSRTMIRMVSSKGNELQIIGMADAVDIHGLVRDFWSHC